MRNVSSCTPSGSTAATVTVARGLRCAVLTEAVLDANEAALDSPNSRCGRSKPSFATS
eukprot:CAMPEP_0196787714 /NCGR_PEP_ID=MMETSP1104-20130614/23587_1 /TAXON_ID=33652 /ORGANISM="Cafeteria sp., Strain Caron Lab Isolate" /LENGTH=57 /DNA_ID=CAMNT_0042158053 /DNA_START=1 /DNA_END=174 /DNA_ORIENTATION=+